MIHSIARFCRSARFLGAVRLNCLDVIQRNARGLPRLIGPLLVCCAVSAAGLPQTRPLALKRVQYEVRAGESVAISAPSETLDFLLHARSRSVQLSDPNSGPVFAAPDRAGDQILLGASSRAKAGTYTATITATSAAGEQRTATAAIVVKPRQTVPSGATRPPVVLLNGWQEGFTGTCSVAASSADTFGNLAQYLVSDGVPIVYLFDNCLEDPDATIETLGADLGTFLQSIKYADGTQVPQIDLVAFSLGGLIARAYLAGLQPDGTVTPPTTTLVRKLILIATPNFGSFVAGNYPYGLTVGTQAAELIPGSAFLWNLATWNQRGDDLRGVDAMAIVGNAGLYVPSSSATTGLSNASDGLVDEISASVGFGQPGTPPTQVVPYCHIDPSTFTNTTLGTFNCNAAGIANVTSQTQETGEIVRSFLAGTTDWESVGTAASDDQYLKSDGGIYFAMQNSTGSYVTDLTGVMWGSVALANGGESNTVYYADFVNGTGQYTPTSTSLGTINCGTLTEDVGYFSAARCKISTAIFSIGPLASGAARIVNSGTTITIKGNTFGQQCHSCSVVAVPQGSSQQTTLQISSWSNTQITAMLPASLTGYMTITVTSALGIDSIPIMAAVAGPSIVATPTSLQFAYTTGGTAPAAQSIQITNGGGGTLAWTATASDTWLSISPDSGTASSALSVSVSPAGLSAGTYTGSIQIAASGASNTPLSVAVTLTVTAGAASLVVSPQSLNFSFAVGSSAPAAQTVSITNGGSGTLAWTASSSVFWASVSPASGNAPATLSITANPANLAAGTYTGNVQITVAGASGSPASVAITLVVTGTQPAGNITAVANGASFETSFASATWVTIFGTNLSASTQTWSGADFVNGLLPASLDGVSVTINGVPAYVEYISQTQINVLAPDDPSTGAVEVQVTAAQKSNTFTAQKQAFAPAFFTFGDNKHVAAQHADYSYLGPPGLIAGVTTTPAAPGETVLLYGTGFGPTNPALPTAQLVTTAEPLANLSGLQITIGGVQATVQFAGLVASGLYQFNVVVPAGLPEGDASLVATIDGVQSQSGLSITIASQ